jgi:hypothetical protein
MGKLKKASLLVCTVIFAAVTAVAAAVTGRAETTMPDLSHLDSYYLLSDNRQILPVPGGFYAVSSTDSRYVTYVTLVDANGYPLDSDPAMFLFVYQKAAVCGDDLYLAGNTPGSESTVSFTRLHLPDRSRVTNQASGVSCDFSRGFYAKPGGKLYLATGPAETPPDSSSPFFLYLFSDSEGQNLVGTPEPGFTPGDSDPSSSDSSESSSPQSTLSSQPSSSQPPSSSSSSDPESAPVYRFDQPITVAALQEHLDAEGRGSSVRVTGADGNAVTAGNVCTGAVVEILRNGQIDGRVTAVVAGDLTGTGTITPQDSLLLYEYCIGQQNLSGLSLEAADIDGDGRVDTSDMLKMKSFLS